MLRVQRVGEFDVCSDQVHHHVLVEGGSPLGRHLADVHDGLGIVSVHVEDGGVDHAGHVRGVGRGARHAGICGETNLHTHTQSEYNSTNTDIISDQVLLWFLYLHTLHTKL